jgi:4-hydroxybenzoate polyprenyltransferase
LVLPTLWTLVLGAKNVSAALLYFPLFIAGAFLTRSAGCIINDLYDINIDSKVERTMKRPLAARDISRTEALVALGILLLLAFLLLLILPQKAIVVGVIAILPIAIYPFMKRITDYPQVFLGLTFNLGVLIAWYTVTNSREYVAVLIYISAALWTIGYDTIYAHQDAKDDKKVGIKSMALTYGENSSTIIWNVYKAMLLTLGIAGLNCSMNLFFYLFLAITSYQLNWQVKTLDINDAKNCNERFQSNISAGVIFLIGCLLGKL